MDSELSLTQWWCLLENCHNTCFFMVFEIAFLCMCFNWKSSLDYDRNRGCGDRQSVQTWRVCACVFWGSSDAGRSVCMRVCVCVYVVFHTWKPFCWMWSNCSRSACMLLTILLWWPIRDTPILLTSLLRKQQDQTSETEAIHWQVHDEWKRIYLLDKTNLLLEKPTHFMWVKMYKGKSHNMWCNLTTWWHKNSPQH